jgi:multiple sugar transport system permease protein
MRSALTRAKARQTFSAYLMLLPFLVVYFVFFLWPAAEAVLLSFTDSTLSEPGNNIGFDNYVKLFQDPDFWQAAWNTIYFCILTVLPLTALGLLFAVLVHRLNRGRSVVQALFFLPFVMPVSVVTWMWRWILNPNIGIVNQLFSLDTSWFSDPSVAMPSVAVVTIWWTVGFNLLLYLSALQNIPKDLYDAAAIDGATGLRAFWSITWPLLRPTTVLVLIVQLIASLKIFNQVYLLCGPGSSQRPLLQMLYETAFVNLNAGYASGIAILLFLLVLGLTLVQAFSLRRKTV